LELVQIFLKRTKNPTVFLKYVAPLVNSLKENQKDKAKDALVEKISSLLKSYMNRQQSFGLTYSVELEECVAEIINTAKKVNSKKVHKTLKYLLKCILAIVFKADLKRPVQGLTSTYKDALEAYITKRGVELDSDYFKELISKYKTIGVELLELLIQGSNFKSKGGSKNDVRRDECLNLLTSLVQSSSSNSEYLVSKIVQDQQKIGDLIVDTLENIEEAKTKNFSALVKYCHLYKLIIKLLAQTRDQTDGDQVLKQKAGSLVTPFKTRVTKRLKELEEKEFVKSSKNHVEKVKGLIQEFDSIQ